MADIDYLPFDQVNPDSFTAVMNEDSLRTHLVEHPYFDANTLRTWMKDKIDVDRMPGCRVRAVFINGHLAGWCGIQPDGDGFELAIVIAKDFWGFGLSIFRTLMGWARELEHSDVRFHLLDSRPEYKALTRKSTRVHETQLYGRLFTTYHIPVDRP